MAQRRRRRRAPAKPLPFAPERCIYCGRDDAELGDEHVIPAGLNGTWVLTRASCRECEAVTSRIEERVLRGQLLAARAALGVFTRNPDKRPESLALTIDGDMKSVPTSDHPVNLTLLEFEPPGFISGRPGRTGVPIRGVARYTDAERVVRLVRRHAAPETDPSGAGTTMNVEWSNTYAHTDIENFMRLLVKIGYGAHVGLYGTGAMLPNLAQALILGQNSYLSYFVGTVPMETARGALPSPVTRVEWSADATKTMEWHRVSVRRSRGMWQAYIQLFRHLFDDHPPIYHVILGPATEAAR